jgi:hypothetical protein
MLCQVEEPNSDVRGYANGPESYWVRSKVSYSIVLVTLVDSRILCRIRLENPVLMSKDMPTDLSEIVGCRKKMPPR